MAYKTQTLVTSRTSHHDALTQVYDDELAAQQSAYSVAGVDESAPIERPQKRKKKQADYTSDKRAKTEEEKPRRERQITAVYVSNLPVDVTTAEVQEDFS